MQPVVSSNKINPTDVSGHNKPSVQKSGDGEGFKSALKEALQPVKEAKLENKSTKPIGFKFSNHAVERMRSRGISFSPDQMQKIEEAFTKAKEKGGKEALIVTDNSAMVASVKNKTIVTVMDKQAMKENVFTNIDSTVFI